MSYWSLSYIDDVHGARVGREEEIDVALEGAAQEAGIRWDRSKDWRGRKARGGNARPTATPKVQGPESQSSMGDSTAPD